MDQKEIARMAEEKALEAFEGLTPSSEKNAPKAKPVEDDEPKDEVTEDEAE